MRSNFPFNFIHMHMCMCENPEWNAFHSASCFRASISKKLFKIIHKALTKVTKKLNKIYIFGVSVLVNKMFKFWYTHEWLTLIIPGKFLPFYFYKVPLVSTVQHHISYISLCICATRGAREVPDILSFQHSLRQHSAPRTVKYCSKNT